MLKAIVYTLLLFGGMFTVWLIVPTEQTLIDPWPNVMIVGGFGSEDLEPISFDNTTLDTVPAAQASSLNGFFQYDHLFYSKTFDRFIEWENKYKARVWTCTLMCSALNRSATNAQLALVHYESEPKKNLWYMIELRDDDVNSPIIYGRTKFRKTPTYRNAPWLTVTPGGQVKPKDLKEVYITTGWDAFRFDTPLKWAGFATVGIVIAALCWRSREKED